MQSRERSIATTGPADASVPPAHGTGPAPLLRIRGLRVSFDTPVGLLRAVDGLDLDVLQGERVGVVGESGSGKSVAALAILGLHQRARIEGEIWFDGRELAHAPEQTLRRIRGAEIGLIFQDPLSALDPVATVGDQITEVLRIRGVGRPEARRRAIDILARVGVQRAAERIDDYPHQFSGGMRQRVLIAAAVIAEPKLLIADEPTTALDVRVQAQVLQLIHGLAEERRMGLLLITHDLGVVAGHTERMYVMYGGRVLETCDTDELFYASVHPYTWGLLGSVPRINGDLLPRLETIRGQPPSPFGLPSGCVFVTRCDYARDVCHAERPALRERAGSLQHAAACLFAGELPRPAHLPVRPRVA